MKNIYKILSVVFVVLILNSCETTTTTTTTKTVTRKWIAPKYTSVEKILNLKIGMNVETATRTLGIQPYDIYTMQKDGITIIVYNYRIKERRLLLPISDKYEATKDEKSQKAGKTWYQNKSHKLYVVLKKQKMVSLLTDAGRKDGEPLLILNNDIRYLSKEQVIKIAYLTDVYR